MPATPDGHHELVLAGEVDRVDHVGRAGALDGQRRTAGVHRVERTPDPVVPGVSRSQDLPTNLGPQALDRFITQLDSPAVESQHGRGHSSSGLFVDRCRRSVSSGGALVTARRNGDEAEENAACAPRDSIPTAPDLLVGHER